MAAAGLCPRDEEAVFSSSEDQIRTSVAGVGPSVVPRKVVAREIVASEIGRRDGPSDSGRAWVSRAAESLFSVLFPSDCRICGDPLLNISRLPVCPGCLAGVHPVRGKVCSVCGERVLSSYAQSDVEGLMRCPVCRRIDRPFGRAAAYGSYDGGLRELIHLLKYNGVRPAAKVLGRMLAEVWATLEPCFEPAGLFDRNRIAVIPVPLYRTKRRQRGFNQAELIAQAALKYYPARERLQLVPDLLLRTRDTPSQIGLTSHQRRENLRGAFTVARASEVIGREVLLVDDVYTTGTTATECSRVLRRAGASRVWVATVARTLKLASNYAEFRPGEGESADRDEAEDRKIAVAKAAG